MKKISFKKWALVAVIGILSPLSAAYVSLTNPLVTPSPLEPIEKNGVGVVTFGMVETSNENAPAKDVHGEENIQISVELNKLKVTNDDTSLIRGTLLDYFSIYYDADAKRLIFTQKAEFPGFGDANVTIPVEVTANAKSTDNSLNGFNANISATAKDTTADGHASAFTFTKAPLVATDDTGVSVNGASGGIAFANIVDNDTLNNAGVELGTDVNISSITNVTPLIIDIATGSVTVPAGTPEGAYSETYILCESAHPDNCDEAIISVIVTASPIEAKDDSVNPFNGSAGGVAIDNITSNDILNGLPVTFDDVNITEVTNDTPLAIDIETGTVTVPANTPAGTYEETYTLCEKLNPTNCDTAKVTVVVDDAIPDYIPTLNAQGTIVSGPESAIDMVIRVGEFNDGENFDGDLIFTIVKNSNLDLSFDPMETTRQGKVMQNNMWEFRETSGLYILTYKGNGRIFPKFSSSRIGLSGHFYSPNDSKGQFALVVTIAGGTGEEDLGNNKDTDVLEYNNL